MPPCVIRCTAASLAAPLVASLGALWNRKGVQGIGINYRACVLASGLANVNVDWTSLLFMDTANTHLVVGAGQVVALH